MEDQKPDSESATESATAPAPVPAPDSTNESSADKAPDSASAPATTAGASTDKDKHELTVLDLGVGVLLLTLMAFVVVNVYVMYVASRYNDTICKNSIDLAKVAALEGKDTDSVVRAAYGCMDKCAMGGFFVEHPQLIMVNDEITPQLRTVTVATSTKILVPAFFLIFDKGRLDKDGQHMTFKTVYQFKLSNPKNCQGTHKIKLPGKTLQIQKPDTAPSGPAPK